MSERQVINEINDASQPQVIEHFIGQDKVKALVRTALEASWIDGGKFPDTLALGSPGLGKTQISHLIAKETASECKETLASDFSSISDLNRFLLDCKDGDVLFLDEIHTIKKDLMVVLYRAIENRKIFGKKSDGKSFSIELPQFTLIAATTDFYLLTRPLIDRFKLVLHFEYYSEQEIETIIKHRCQKIGWSTEPQVFTDIGKISRGIPRVALRILENARRVSRADGSDVITVEHLKKSCQLDGLDNLGLNSNEQNLLRILAREDKPVRLNTLAMMMGTLSRNVSQNYEPYLFRAGLITKNDKGRMLTDKGYEHIQNNL
ncbi:MAG: AAA family ATPase [Planctomycetes bacterium]|nr:AAA family ATPase [Planctomycetota bacterium]